MTAMAAPISASPPRSPRRAATSRSISPDSDPQSTSFVNSSHANMQAAVAMAFAYLIDAEIPKNTGALRPLKVVAKQGTVVWADPGRPVTLCTSHPSNEIVEAIVKALSASCPERAMAGLEPEVPDRDPGRGPAHGQEFHLASVSGASRRRRVVRRRRLVVDRRMAFGRRAEVRQPRSRRGALSPAFPAA